MKVLLANPRGFCAGVDRAIDIVERAIELFGAPIYVRHEVVHNRFVVDRLRGPRRRVRRRTRCRAGWRDRDLQRAWRVERGRAGSRAPRARRVRCHLPAGHQGAHGGRPLRARRPRRDPDRPRRPPGGGGHDGALRPGSGGRIHLVETVADAGATRRARRRELAVVTQTTLSVDDTARIVAALRERFPALASPRKEDICYATQNRQDAVKQLVAQCDVLVVVGSQSSSNSNRLREIATTRGIPGYLVDGAEDLKREWFEGKKCGRCDGRRVRPRDAGASRWSRAARMGRAGRRSRSSGARRTSCSACRRRCAA